MTSEEILRANNVYDKILSEPLEIYNAFIEYFGEDLVDMIYPSFSKIIENYDLSNMSESKIFETIIPDLKSFNIIIRFPKVKIENEKQKGIITSEKVGDYSVSFTTSIDTRTTEGKRLYRIAKMYLAHTGLLYRGV